MNALSYLIRPLSTSWWSVWPPRILFFSVLKKLLCSKKHLLLFTVTAGRANVVFKTHEPWSPSLFTDREMPLTSEYSTTPPTDLCAFLYIFMLPWRILPCICLHRNFGSKQIISILKTPTHYHPSLSVQEVCSYRRGGNNQRSKLSKKAIISHNRKK